MASDVVSLRPDIRGGNVCGVDGAPERVPYGEPALHDVLGSDDGRIRGGYLQVQYRVRGLAETAATSFSVGEQSTGLGDEGEEGASGGIEESIRRLEITEEEGDDDDEDGEYEVEEWRFIEGVEKELEEHSQLENEDEEEQDKTRGSLADSTVPQSVATQKEASKKEWDNDSDDVD